MTVTLGRSVGALAAASSAEAAWTADVARIVTIANRRPMRISGFCQMRTILNMLAKRASAVDRNTNYSHPHLGSLTSPLESLGYEHFQPEPRAKRRMRGNARGSI